MKGRVVVGMSGGVDSSVAALLLKEQGWDVIGVFMNNWEETDEQGVCPAVDDWADVREVCDRIGIPYYSVNFSREYMEGVFSHFLAEYRAGRTPNPDVLCNREIKFKAFLNLGLELEAEKIATGHFVRTDDAGHLLRGADPAKDQSYFLYMVQAPQLRRSLFPVGGMTKGEVRALAEARGLSVSRKKDSTGVCFIGERNFKRFLQQYLPAQPGDMVTPEGEVVGRHDGLMYYTLGQRRGLGIGGGGTGERWFVLGKDMDRNRLLVAQGEDHPALWTREALCGGVTWVLEEPREGEPFRCTCKYRYRQEDQPVTAVLRQGRLHLIADTPQRAVTPGQSAVLYLGERCLGGGIVEETMGCGLPGREPPTGR